VISEEKLTHIVHLMIDGLYKEDMVDYPDDDAALKEAKRVCLTWLKNMSDAGEAARRRIRTQKSPPLEGSPGWENLYEKYLEEELNKRGG
jgi:hypothetical protein